MFFLSLSIVNVLLAHAKRMENLDQNDERARATEREREQKLVVYSQREREERRKRNMLELYTSVN